MRRPSRCLQPGAPPAGHRAAARRLSKPERFPTPGDSAPGRPGLKRSGPSCTARAAARRRPRLILFAYGVQELGVEASADWLHGLKIVAVAVVAFALWGMGRTLAPDRTRITIAVVAAAVILLWGGIAAQLLVIGGGALLGLIILRPPEQRADAATGVSGGTRAALRC